MFSLWFFNITFAMFIKQRSGELLVLKKIIYIMFLDFNKKFYACLLYNQIKRI